MIKKMPQPNCLYTTRYCCKYTNIHTNKIATIFGKGHRAQNSKQFSFRQDSKSSAYFVKCRTFSLNRNVNRNILMSLYKMKKKKQISLTFLFNVAQLFIAKKRRIKCG